MAAALREFQRAFRHAWAVVGWNFDESAACYVVSERCSAPIVVSGP